MIVGFGMAVTVAPLTTVVMSSVPQDRAGTASGINNALARVAGVLAIAVLGIIMVAAFGSRLRHNLAHTPVSPEIVQQLEANSSKLGGLQAPAGADDQTRAAIREAIRKAFVFGFRVVMLMCAALSLVSAGIAWLYIAAGQHG